MGLLNTVGRVVNAAVKEARTPESFATGKTFENVVKKMFPEEDWILFKMTQDFSANKDRFEKSSEEPDFRFQHKNSKKHINVECKFRSGLFNDKVEWCKYYQLKRYKAIDAKFNNVYLLLGLGGSAKKPDCIFKVPMADIKYNGLFPSWLKKYEVDRGHKFKLNFGKLV